LNKLTKKFDVIFEQYL